MKKLLSLTILSLFLFALAACSTAQASDTTTGTSTSVANIPTEGNSPMQLALGTFALEDTEYAITTEQATELLQLWKAAQALSDSDTITAEEFQAVFNQIEDTLTAEQANFITSMDFSQETMTALGEKYGFTFGPGNGGGFDTSNMTAEQQATAEAFRESVQQSGGQAPADGGSFPGGGPGGGAPPDGGFGGPGGGFPDEGGDISSLPEAQQTVIASGAGRGPGGGLPTALYEAIIEFLEGKVQ